MAIRFLADALEGVPGEHPGLRNNYLRSWSIEQALAGYLIRDRPPRIPSSLTGRSEKLTLD
jgi:hypothetical protein